MTENKQRHLIVDADLLVYRFCWIAESTYKWTDDLYTKVAHMDVAWFELEQFLDQLRETLDADSITLALSDTEACWRRQVLPGYKSHRPGWGDLGDWSARGTPERPMLFKPLRDRMKAELGAIVAPRLEGDDILGIMLTHPNADRGRIACTVDKDLRTVPGLHFNFDKPDEGVQLVTEGEAAYNHLFQTLTGDTTDGYKGVPRVGPVKAEKMLEPFWGTGGVPGGRCFDDLAAWPAVVEAYRKAGIENLALPTAQVARILQAGDYNQETAEITLWTPPMGDE